MKEKFKNPEKYYGIYYIKPIQTYCVSCKKNIVNKNSSLRRT